MRSKQIPIALPDTIRDWYQQQADSIGIPLATYLRMKLTEAYTNATRESVKPEPAAARPRAINDEPDLMNVW
jgi:hypothetical protein